LNPTSQDPRNRNHQPWGTDRIPDPLPQEFESLLLLLLSVGFIARSPDYKMKKFLRVSVYPW
jgi:hypothetical protein